MPTESAFKTALIVDDDPIFVEVAKAMLAARGIRSIKTAASAQAAFEDFDAGRDHPDLVLCDLNMPSFDGVEFLERLQHANCRSRILITSGAHESVVRAALVLGRTYGLDMLGALVKPMTGTKLDGFLGADHAARCAAAG